MKKFLIWLTLPTIALLMVSCDDSTDNPVSDNGNGNGDTSYNAADYMPLAVGNYWIYETKFYDEDGNEYSGNDPELMATMDTMTIISEAFFEGKQSFKFLDTQVDEDEDDDTYLAFENNYLYSWFGITDEDDDEEMPTIGLDSRWLMMLGPIGVSEDVFSIDTTYTETEDGESYTINMLYEMNIKYEDNGNYTYDGVTADSKKSTIISNVRTEINGFPFVVSEQESVSIFMKGIGIVESGLVDIYEVNGITWTGRQRLVEYNLN